MVGRSELKKKDSLPEAEMSGLNSLLAVFLPIVILFGTLPPGFRLLGRLIGNNIRSKTQQRRELLQSRALEEESKQEQQTQPQTSTLEEEEWERVSPGTTTPPGQLFQNAIGAPDVTFEGIIGFFHPFCNAGGGGERVLFAAINAMQQKYPKALCVVYTGDHDASKEQILTNATNRFNIHLEASRVTFLYLSTREWVLASTWPHFTLLGQSLGSLALGWEAANLLVPDVIVDTMGYTFVLALWALLFPSVPRGAYVHYPTISTDMLSSLADEQNTGRGVNAGTGKGWKGKGKKAYWVLFAKLYGWVGGMVDVVMTNSSWTQAHISSLWSQSRNARSKNNPIQVVYPPCAVKELEQKVPVDATSEQHRSKSLLYIAQFRPEKQHSLIIDAFADFLKRWIAKDPQVPPPKLVLVGSVRDDHDEKRVYALRLQANPIKEHVEFFINAKWDKILELLTSCSIGVNGMWNEHFGIGVVEYQAAGLISVVHDSGGPKEDIVVDIEGRPTGKFPERSENPPSAISLRLTLIMLQVSMHLRNKSSPPPSKRLSHCHQRIRWRCGSVRERVLRDSLKKCLLRLGSSSCGHLLICLVSNDNVLCS